MPVGLTPVFNYPATDLTTVLDRMIADSPRFISLFSPGPRAIATKHQWLQDSLAATKFTGTHTTGGALTVSAADAALCRVGQEIVLAGSSALFKIATVSGTTVTVTLVASRASGISAVTDIPTGAQSYLIMFDPVAENSIDGEKILHQSGDDYNYTQIFRKDIELSRTAQEIKTLDSSNAFTSQSLVALDKLMREINNAAIHGKRTDNVVNALRTMGGLYEFAGVDSGNGLSVTVSSKPLDSVIVNDAAQLISDAGGRPDAIIVSSGQRRALSADLKNNLVVVQNDPNRGAYVANIVSDSTGETMKIVVDPGIPEGQAWVVDTSGFGMSYLSPIIDTDATTASNDGNRRKIIGELTLEFKNARKRLCLITGLS